MLGLAWDDLLLRTDGLFDWRTDKEEHQQMYLSADTGVRSCVIDVRSDSGREQIYDLLDGADIFYANRLPGLLESLGMDAHAASKIRPGIVHVIVSCHGKGGPWKNRVGFDQIARAVTGCLVAEGGSLKTPKLPPTNIVNDYLGAWMAATGAMIALIHGAAEGGSAMSTFHWTKTVGTGGDHEQVDWRRSNGAGHTSKTPTQFAHAISARGTDAPVWLPNPKAYKPTSRVLMGAH
ncbi:CoA-transferase family III domain-containing protein [Cladochytrium replicatum]|nr:CoA-transferase family III domain-containing protein [Cladochytrium replicatum]